MRTAVKKQKTKTEVPVGPRFLTACPKKLVDYGLHEPCLLVFPPNVTLVLVL